MNASLKVGELRLRWSEIREEARKTAGRNLSTQDDKRNWIIAETRLAVAGIRQWEKARRRQNGSAAWLPEGGDLVLLVEERENMEPEKETARKVAAVVRDLADEVVGYIEAPESGPFRVRLNSPWDKIAEDINQDIEAGEKLIGPDRRFRVIAGTGESELHTVMHTIRVLSERKLRVSPPMLNAGQSLPPKSTSISP